MIVTPAPWRTRSRPVTRMRPLNDPSWIATTVFGLPRDDVGAVPDRARRLRVAVRDLVRSPPYLDVGDHVRQWGMGSVAAQAGTVGRVSAFWRTWSESWTITSCLAVRYSPHLGSRARRHGMAGTQGSGRDDPAPTDSNELSRWSARAAGSRASRMPSASVAYVREWQGPGSVFGHRPQAPATGGFLSRPAQLPALE